EGRLTGRVALSGTPARPELKGQLTVRDLSAQEKKLGAADVYVEASSAGALLHVGIDPPGGGNFLGHVKLDADLGGRTLLSRGAAPILSGKLSGEMTSRHLDLGFASGLVRNLRRAGGTLDGSVKVGGTVSKPVAEGDAHLRRGLFEVVGQGVYEDVGLDADSTHSGLSWNARIPDARSVINQPPNKNLPSLKKTPGVPLIHPGERPHPPGRDRGDAEAEEQAPKTATFRMHALLDLNH